MITLIASTLTVLKKNPRKRRKNSIKTFRKPQSFHFKYCSPHSDSWKARQTKMTLFLFPPSRLDDDLFSSIPNQFSFPPRVSSYIFLGFFLWLHLLEDSTKTDQHLSKRPFQLFVRFYTACVYAWRRRPSKSLPHGRAVSYQPNFIFFSHRFSQYYSLFITFC